MELNGLHNLSLVKVIIARSPEDETEYKFCHLYIQV